MGGKWTCIGLCVANLSQLVRRDCQSGVRGPLAHGDDPCGPATLPWCLRGKYAPAQEWSHACRRRLPSLSLRAHLRSTQGALCVADIGTGRSKGGIPK
ncbi:hypothetical protein OH76DRAFT_1408847 [Lentinus brumalis]|uniref:Uncharacterized protein n=1 Tax=Lentinus brumalis TaxID=2498619 RepID=A0A371CWG0_9APHY|nr:hypothetical protein OH76DRAFT_1408847 [Polyporus brumalis]